MKTFKNTAGFTLIELLISVGLFAVVAVFVSSLMIDTMRASKDSNLQNQVYEDARYTMQKIAEEIRGGMVDYDEYYAQNVVGADNWGQNYGRYYSAFYNPGADTLKTGKVGLLGFDCNEEDSTSLTGWLRNKPSCKIQTKTKDKNTGQNPFDGKVGGSDDLKSENAFCGAVKYEITKGNDTSLTPIGNLPDGTSLCPAEDGAKTAQQELYLISADSRQKTIIAKEKIGETKDNPPEPIYALSILRMKGEDSGEDGVVDKFTCADGFDCTDTGGKTAGCLSDKTLPASRAIELNSNNDECDTKDLAFSKDFIPITPFRINVTDFKIYISPAENPNYAFAEKDEQFQPKVSIVLTVEPNPDYTGSKTAFQPITLEETISSKLLTPIKAPVLIE